MTSLCPVSHPQTFCTSHPYTCPQVCRECEGTLLTRYPGSGSPRSLSEKMPFSLHHSPLLAREHFRLLWYNKDQSLLRFLNSLTLRVLSVQGRLHL